jgi:hypothetical protein
MYNELRLYCKSEGINEYVLRSQARISSRKSDTGKNEKELRAGKDAGSMKKAG